VPLLLALTWVTQYGWTAMRVVWVDAVHAAGASLLVVSAVMLVAPRSRRGAPSAGAG
jgi:succinate dehydrogenase hydrophobic anchor subunit